MPDLNKNSVKMSRVDAIQAIMGAAIEAANTQQYLPMDQEKVPSDVFLKVVLHALVSLDVTDKEIVKAMIEAPYLDVPPNVAALLLETVRS